MTCIVGIAIDGDVWLGGDSVSSNGWTAHRRDTAKLWRAVRRGEPWVLGACGSYRALQLMRHVLQLPELPEEDDQLEGALVKTWTSNARQVFKEHGWIKQDDGEDKGTTMLIGVKGRLFLLQDDWSIIEASVKIEAIGSGKFHAEGAMWAVTSIDPKERLLAGLRAAAQFQPGAVGPPYTIIHLADKEEYKEES